MTTTERIIEKIEEAGYTSERIEEKAEELKDSYGKLMENENLLYHKVAKELSVRVEDKNYGERPSRKEVNVEDVKKESCPEYFNIRGYVIDMWDDETRKGKPALKFYFADETGIIQGATYETNEVDSGISYFKSNIKLFEEIKLNNTSKFSMTINEGTDDEFDFTQLTSTYSEIEEIEDRRLPSEGLKDVDEMVLDNGDVAYIEGMVVGESIRTFDACIECGRKVNQETGECSNCGETESIKRYWQTLYMNSKESNSHPIDMPPQITDGESLDGKLLKIVGIWDSNQGIIKMKGYAEIQPKNVEEKTKETRKKTKEPEINKQRNDILQAVHKSDKPITIEEIGDKINKAKEIITDDVNMLISKGYLFSPQIGKVDISDDMAEDIGITTDTSEDKETTDNVDDGIETFECHYCDRELASKGGRTRHEKAQHLDEYKSDHPDEFDEEENTEEENNEGNDEDNETKDDTNDIDIVIEWLDHYPALPEKNVKKYIEKNENIHTDTNELIKLLKDSDKIEITTGSNGNNFTTT